MGISSTWGVIVQARGGVYRVALEEGGRVEASLRGRLKRSGRPDDRVVVGDRARVEDAGEGAWTVEEVAPRRTSIVRTGPGRRPKVVAANVDRLVAVVAAAEPEPRLPLIDHLLVIAESNHVEAAIVVNKVDLEDAASSFERIASLYRGIGYPVLEVSALTGAGLHGLADLLCDGTSALVGPSGVGKSSLLNALEPRLELRTGELSRRVGRGRHTTVSSRLIELSCGGWVADTPGFSDIDVWGVERSSLADCFPEIRGRAGGCRFQDCAHLSEPSCAVRDAVDSGEIVRSRYESYLRLRDSVA